MQIQRGQRGKLDDLFHINAPIQITMQTSGSAVYDYCCFGVDSADQLSDDRYMVFYNQPKTPQQEIMHYMEDDRAVFQVSLTQLPDTIQKLVFTVSIDGNGRMGQIQSHTVEILQNGAVLLQMEMTGKDFLNERAIISMEIYLKSVWRVNAVARGFNGGLSDLLENFGGEEADETAPAPQPAPAPMPAPEPEKPKQESRLEKAFSGVEDKQPIAAHVEALSGVLTELEKRDHVALGNTKAKVVVALDYSSSMRPLYENGTVQKTLDRLVPLGLSFDDNGKIELFLFQNDFQRLADLTADNYAQYVSNVIEPACYPMGGTCYAPVLRAITEGMTVRRETSYGFGGTEVTMPPLVEPGVPTFVLFITDGENEDRRLSDQVIRRAAELNVFIQFIGIGDLLFSYLQEVDELPGRQCDNTGFSRMADLAAVSDAQFYDAVLAQFACWLRGEQ